MKPMPRARHPNYDSARVPRVAMVLAAGRGERLGPLSKRTPKPLVEVGGRPLIDHALGMLATAGVRRIVVNAHYHADMIERHLAGKADPEILVSREEALLDTGGGVRNALDRLGRRPFFVVNADLVWNEGSKRALDRLAATWDEAAMDALLLLYPTVRTFEYYGMGDFLCDPLGRLRRRLEREVAPFIFTGVQILHPRLFRDAPEGAFSLNELYDKAEAEGRLYGVVHDGVWLDAGTPDRLARARRALGGPTPGTSP